MPDSQRNPDNETTLIARRAVAGDSESLGRLLEKFNPPLIALARRRVSRHLQGLYDPEDLVSETWIRALPRIPDLTPRDGRITPVVMKFLSTTLLNRYNSIVQKHIVGKPRQAPIATGDESVPGAPELDDSLEGALTMAVRNENRNAVHEALERLDASDREAVILRGIEQVSNQDAAVILGLSPGALKMRYSRALQRMTALLPGSIFSDLVA